MIFNRHFHLEGRHAELSASKGSWVNYSDEKFDRSYLTSQAAAKGTRLHDLAAQLIREGVKLPATTKTLNMYVNDAIGFRMVPEQSLMFSENFFGTADTISFRKNMLRVHDLKTGKTPAKVLQLEIYCALFCLEYAYKPFDIQMEARIYQNDEVQIYDVDPDSVYRIMDKGVRFDKRIRQMREEAAL